MEYPQSILNWKEEEHYPELKDRTLTEWKWEFLRRNPEYQRYWDIFSGKPERNKNGKWRGLPFIGQLLETYDGYTNEPVLSGETCEEYEDRICQTGVDPIVMPYAEFMCSHFKIEARPLDWRNRIPTDTFDTFIGEHYSITPGISEPPWQVELIGGGSEWVNMREKLSALRSTVSFTFDVRHSIDDQVALLKQELLGYQKYLLEKGVIEKIKKPIHQLGKFRDQIRILDAFADGSTTEEVADIMYGKFESSDNPMSLRVKNTLESAKKIRDLTYWKIC